MKTTFFAFLSFRNGFHLSPRNMNRDELPHHFNIDNQMTLIANGFKPTYESFHRAIDDFD